jgi:hypothetical protein
MFIFKLKELCHLFKQKCSKNLTIPQFISNYSDLNSFLTKNQIETTIYKAIKKFNTINLNDNNFARSCLNRFNTKYCEALRIIGNL